MRGGAKRAGERRLALLLAITSLACAGGTPGSGPPARRARPLPADATVHRDPALGTIRFASGPDLARELAGDPALREARAHDDPAAIARAFLAGCADAFRLDDPAAELALRGVRADREGRRIVRFDQRWHGVPVLRGELRVHVDAEGRVVVVSGATIPTPRAVDPEPRLDAAAARERAAAALGRPAGGCARCPAELVVAAPDGAPPRLAWRVRPPAGALHDELLVDARTGDILERIPVVLPGARGPGLPGTRAGEGE